MTLSLPAPTPPFRTPTAPFALNPFFYTPTVNHPVVLENGDLRIYRPGAAHVYSGSVEFHWLPSPTFRVRMNDYVPTAVTPELEAGDIVVEAVATGRFYTGFITSAPLSMNITLGSRASARGVVTDDFVRTNHELDRVVFHCSNFPSYLGAYIKNTSTTGANVWAGRVEQRVGEWDLILDEVEDRYRPQGDGLTEDGGYAITHVGLIQRADRGVFVRADAEHMLSTLGHFLSFCRGAWTAPALAVGFAGGEQRWRHVKNWRLSRYRIRQNWFDEMATDWVSALAGFSTLFNDPMWRDSIANAVHWYVEANLQAGAIEGSIILSQCALETLAWTLLVQDRKVVSENGFKNLPAEDKIRLLLSTSDIPFSIPPQFTALQAIARAENWADAAHATTAIRNSFVHTSAQTASRRGRIGREAVWDAYLLSQWFLELTLLRLCAYDGTYHNRLVRAGTTFDARQRVPWA